MAITYSATLKSTRMTAVRDAIDGGAGPGTLEIGTTGMASVLAVLTLADPCGTISSGVLTFTVPFSDASADATGTAAAARVKDSSGNIVISGLTVGTSGTDVVLTSTSITSGQAVTITSAAITHG